MSQVKFKKILMIIVKKLNKFKLKQKINKTMFKLILLKEKKVIVLVAWINFNKIKFFRFKFKIKKIRQLFIHHKCKILKK